MAPRTLVCDAGTSHAKCESICHSLQRLAQWCHSATVHATQSMVHLLMWSLILDDCEARTGICDQAVESHSDRNWNRAASAMYTDLTEVSNTTLQASVHCSCEDVVSAGGGFYSSSSGVVNLNEASFPSAVTGSGDLWFVEFYAPWYVPHPFTDAAIQLYHVRHVMLHNVAIGWLYNFVPALMSLAKPDHDAHCSICRCGHCKNLKPEYIELAKCECPSMPCTICHAP